MRRRIDVWIMALLVAGFGLLSCESEYTQTVKAEMAKGIRYDSLFHGISFGQSKKAFYDLCWEKNRQGLFNAGNRENFVQTSLKNPQNVEESLDMFFYPDFNEQDEIIGMEMEYRYKAWAPWNEELFAKNLVPALKDTLMKWYGGNDFITIADESDSLENIWVKVDGNRRIALKVKDDEVVQVKFADLSVEK